jgi:hypothetical protein
VRAVAVTLLVSTTLSVAEPAQLTLGCQGTETSKGGAGTAVNQINIGIIVDFQKQTVVGLSDSRLTITGVDETTISFSGVDRGWTMNGTIDRVTGALVAFSSKFDPGTGKQWLSFSHDLLCRPAQRMF